MPEEATGRPGATGPPPPSQPLPPPGGGRAPPPQLQLQHWRSVASTKSEQQLVRKWFDFAADPCGYFDEGKMKACTLSLTVLVAIEMFNALNALSETRLA